MISTWLGVAFFFKGGFCFPHSSRVKIESTDLKMYTMGPK